MKNKNLTIAIALSLVAGIMIFFFLSSKEKEIKSKGNANKVVTAKTYIPPGMTITESVIKEVEVPELYIQPGAIRKADYAVGRIALAGISENEQIMANKITLNASRLSELVPIGQRAVTIQLDTNGGVNEMLKIGDIVDIVGTFEENGKSSYTATVLQGVKVIAVGDRYNVQEREKREDGMRFSQGLSVTFALDPSDCEIVTFAENKGRLKLTLRNSGDIKPASLRMTNFSNLMRNAQKENVKAAPEGQSMEIIRGTEGEKIQIKR